MLERAEMMSSTESLPSVALASGLIDPDDCGDPPVALVSKLKEKLSPTLAPLTVIRCTSAIAVALVVTVWTSGLARALKV